MAPLDGRSWTVKYQQDKRLVKCNNPCLDHGRHLSVFSPFFFLSSSCLLTQNTTFATFERDTWRSQAAKARKLVGGAFSNQSLTCSSKFRWEQTLGERCTELVKPEKGLVEPTRLKHLNVVLTSYGEESLIYCKSFPLSVRRSHRSKQLALLVLPLLSCVLRSAVIFKGFFSLSPCRYVGF